MAIFSPKNAIFTKKSEICIFLNLKIQKFKKILARKYHAEGKRQAKDQTDRFWIVETYLSGYSSQRHDWDTRICW